MLGKTETQDLKTTNSKAAVSSLRMATLCLHKAASRKQSWSVYTVRLCGRQQLFKLHLSHLYSMSASLLKVNWKKKKNTISASVETKKKQKTNKKQPDVTCKRLKITHTKKPQHMPTHKHTQRWTDAAIGKSTEQVWLTFRVCALGLRGKWRVVMKIEKESERTERLDNRLLKINIRIQYAYTHKSVKWLYLTYIHLLNYYNFGISETDEMMLELFLIYAVFVILKKNNKKKNVTTAADLVIRS